MITISWKAVLAAVVIVILVAGYFAYQNYRKNIEITEYWKKNYGFDPANPPEPANPPAKSTFKAEKVDLSGVPSEISKAFEDKYQESGNFNKEQLKEILDKVQLFLTLVKGKRWDELSSANLAVWYSELNVDRIINSGIEIDRVKRTELDPTSVINGSIYSMHLSIYLNNEHIIKLEIGKEQNGSSDQTYHTGQIYKRDHYYIDEFEYY